MGSKAIKSIFFLFFSLMGDLWAFEDKKTGCMRAQAVVENIDYESLKSSMRLQIYKNSAAFSASKPTIRKQRLTLSQYTPKENTGRLWCKLKTQKALQESSLKFSIEGPPKTCQSMNKYIFQKALEELDPLLAVLYAKSPIKIQFAKDLEFNRGDKWVESRLSIDYHKKNWQIAAPSLQTANWIPLLGGMQYCKLLSKKGAKTLVEDIIDLQNISRHEVSIDGKKADLYYPLDAKSRLATAIFMVGANVDKSYYSLFAAKLAKHGFLVAVPNHNKRKNSNMPRQEVFNLTFKFIKEKSLDKNHPLYDRVDTKNLAVLGHSLGGIAGLAILDNKCKIPTCWRSYKAPAAIKAAMVYGTNTKTPAIGSFFEVMNEKIPILFIQGSQDSKAKLSDTIMTFQQYTQNEKDALLAIKGANHFSINDVQNPKGPRSGDKSKITLSNRESIKISAIWTAYFLKAHMQGDEKALAFIYDGIGAAASQNVELRLKEY